MTVPTGQATGPGATRLTAWRFVLVFGAVSLLGDFVYEGARSIVGPLLASLGASALLVGVVTGAGEAAALALRLVSGPLADRSHRFWAWTMSGYALTVVSVPLLGAAATLWVACTLVIAERVGKAVRSPAKDTLLSHATAVTGRGRGFAIHEALDQVGALLGPLAVAGVLALTGGSYGPALGMLAVPGVALLAVLTWLRSRVPNPAAYEIPAHPVPNSPAYESAADPVPNPAAAEPVPNPAAHESTTGPVLDRAAQPPQGPARLPRAFWVYAAFTAATMTGFATFGVLSYHLVARNVLSAVAVPVLYAAVMGVDALAALATGWLYDRVGARTLAVLPLLAAIVPLLAFSENLALAVAGSLVWGAAVGVQESTLRAMVADLVPPGRRATAYGLFAAVVGVATFAGGALAGVLYAYSVPVLIITTIAIQAAAVLLLAATRAPRTRG